MDLESNIKSGFTFVRPLRRRLWAIAAWVLFFPQVSVPGGTYGTSETAQSADDVSAEAFSLPFEFRAEFAYTGSGDVVRGNREIRDFEAVQTGVSLVFTPRGPLGIWRMGAAFDYYHFGFGSGLEVPETLSALRAVIGLDTQLGDSILLRAEAQPGFYGTDAGELDGALFNVPVLIGGTYILNTDLQFVLGVGIDIERKYPVLPGGGVRWRVARQWVLNAVLPKPRIEYEVAPALTVFAGADLRTGSFRMSETHGTEAGTPRLNRAVLSYSEVRAGAGLTWKVTPDLTISAEGGAIPYRQFDLYRADVRYRQDGVAPYGAISINAAF